MGMDIYAALGGRVRQERTRAGLTLDQLAGDAGISATFLSYIEKGRRKASLATVQKLADALGLQVGALFAAAPASAPDPAYDATREFRQLVRDADARKTRTILDVVRVMSGRRPRTPRG